VTWKFNSKKSFNHGCEAGAPELGILPGAGAQIKNQKQPEPELSLKFRTGAGAMAI